MDASKRSKIENPKSKIEGPRQDDYLVVARRYRPTSFDELIGQEHVARALASAIATGRVGHAYLFTGARGVGKTSAARILAKALNCVNGPTPTPCNQCDICQSIARGDDVDVLEIDGASNRGIDEIRQLRQNAGVRPSRARMKIYIIDEVHMLTKEAFNALLKTLEEPPEHVKFIFATTEPNKIPVTILSRCQRFDFAGIDAVAIGQRLAQIAEAEAVRIDPDAIQIIARRAGGSMRDSQSLLEQLLALGLAEITAADVHALLGTAAEVRVSKLVEHLVANDAKGALGELDAAAAQGVEVAQLLDQLLGYFRDVMVASVGCSGSDFQYVTPSEAANVVALGKQLPVDTILAIVQILENSATRLRTSMHPRTLAEMALVRIANRQELEDLAAIVDALRSGGSVPAGSAASPAAIRADESKKNDRPIAEREPSREPTAVVSAMGRLTEESAPAIWQHVLNNLGELVADQAALFSGIALAGPNHLVVGFPAKYTSCKEFCELPQQKARLEAALTATAGEPIRLEFAVLDDSPDEVQPPPVVGRRQQKARTMAEPFVRRAMELFQVNEPVVEPPEA